MSSSKAPLIAQLSPLPWSLSAVELRERAGRTVEDAERELGELLRLPGTRSIEQFLRPLDRILLRVRDVGSHGSFVFAVHPDEACRTAGREASEAAERFFNSFRINSDAFRALQALPVDDTDGTTRYAVEKMLRELRRAGAEKDASARSRLLELTNEIDRVSNQYNENIAKLDRAVEVAGPDALSGLPPDFLASHAPGSDGKIRITTRYPDFHPVMAYADDPELRRRLLSEFMNRAHPENLAVLDHLLAARFELATSLGYPAYAAYAIEDKMMERPEAVRAFLERVATVLREPARVDLARYLARKRRDLPATPRLELWDAGIFGEGYYDGKLRSEEFGVDSKRLRSYLPYRSVRDGLFALCEELFGIHFRRVTSEGLWHPTVEAYDVTREDRPLGRFFLDLVPREGKFGHAACFGIRDGIVDVQLPQSALVCNFLDPAVPADTARMQYSDVVTFFHEFGHLLHALFSGHGPWLYTTMSFIEWDFVEAPSQLFEEWARDPATLARFARDPDTGEAIPVDLLDRLRGAEALGRSVRWLRQVALAAIALELYDRAPAGLDTSATFRQVSDRYLPMPLAPEYHPTAAWTHLTGYSAFYYTYVWSLVIARDLLSPFRAKGTLTDPETAARYAREILMPGSTRPATELVRAYLGRDFDFHAFEEWSREGLALSRSAPDDPPHPP
ncbi:MAG TPA: M3 family metallopeptidase [Thermoplasmata archaeon]|nr:M3 family metallopeptidase [Thermoplasmata archaeon]